MSARRSCSRRNLLLLLGCVLAAPIFADTTAPQYDPNGNMTSRSTSLGTTDYTYDALDRLKTEFGPGVDQSFGYDGNGNRQSDGANLYTLAPNGNRIQAINGVTVTYDPVGNLLDDGQGRTFAYNAAGRLKEVRVNNALVASYKYNYKGQRTHKITPQGTTLYHYDIQGHLIQTSDPGGVPKQSLHWADDQPIAQVDHASGGDKLVYLHTDHLNTPRTATDQSGTVVWRWEGLAFGNSVPTGSITVNLRFAGTYYDSETGLHYNWNRYYDPKIGRYISSDPIGLEGGLNTYTYVSNNPLRFIDPLGLDINVCYYPGGITHVGYGIVGEQGTSGFYPSVPSPIAPGEVRQDPKDEPRECKTVPSSEDQDKCMLNCRLRRVNNPGIYHIGARQCTSFVRDCMRECGISTGIDRNGDHWQGPRPDRVYEKLPGSGVRYQ